ncbi:MAG: RNA polymerase sigma factor [Dysgonamonadaceae bacterium]|jgi:RNA polymerase sigma-70 factor (ECF subfamily)|nr:RNA polymerase sigma factor [Dysgonamonadaceae bacterium]
MEFYNEEDVLRQLRSEDLSVQKKGFEKVVAFYSEKLYWQIRKIVLSHEDANDLLQNTFIKAWMNIHLFRGEAKLATWLYKIAVNECISFLNHQRAMSQVSIDNEADVFLLNRLESDTYFDGDEAQMLLQKAILTLPEKQRLVFNMRYFDELPYEDISDIVGTSVGALKASYHHAVKKIEKFLTSQD